MENMDTDVRVLRVNLNKTRGWTLHTTLPKFLPVLIFYLFWSHVDCCSETEDGRHVMIEDDILEKCIENGAGVVHIAVEKSSSEVRYIFLPS